MSNNDIENYTFNNSWTVYVHDKNDKNWSISSYRKIWTISDERTFWQFFNSISDFTTYNYYFMKENIQPTHEHEMNKNGADLCYNFRKDLSVEEIDSDHQMPLKEEVQLIVAKLVCEDLAQNEEDSKEINGIEIIAKETKTIIKIWLKNKEYIPEIYHMVDGFPPFKKSRRNESVYGSRTVSKINRGKSRWNI